MSECRIKLQVERISMLMFADDIDYFPCNDATRNWATCRLNGVDKLEREGLRLKSIKGK